MSSYNKSGRWGVIFCGVSLFLGGVAFPLVHSGFDTLVAGVVVAVLGLSALILFAPKRFWLN